MKKNIVGLTVGILVLGIFGIAHSATIGFQGATSQIGTISEVDIGGTLWDATFYDRLVHAPNPEAYSQQFAIDASQALYDLFHTAEFDYYDVNPEYTWGIENATIGNLLTPFFISFVDSFPDYWGGYGSLFTNQSLSSDSLTDAYLFNNDLASSTFSFIQWSESIISEEPPIPAPGPGPAPVPEPSTLLLLGSGLLGLACYGRKRKQA